MNIVTHYAGTRFRSRLEARWAALFDLCGWRWEYEPPEQSWWIPDFLLIGRYGVTKVEVKPIEWWGADAHDFFQQIEATPELLKVRKYVRTVDDWQDVLLLGAYPHLFHKHRNDYTKILGVFLSERWGMGPDIALLGAGYPPHELDFYADQRSSHGYRKGGQRYVRRCMHTMVNAFWRQAGNKVQWRKS
jgi:hypothetical protein